MPAVQQIGREEKMINNEVKTKIYAGVLGKVIGVFYGRPVEGWPYGEIRDRFDFVDEYVAEAVGVPLHVADDDLGGTFTFINALEDLADQCIREGRSSKETAETLRNITSREFGETWLDYVIENKTIFWWGGLGRSTEHTAFMRLKNGIKAPESGSIKTNGKAVAEQIGAQIFMDALALMCPDDPELAAYLVRQSASVSHDGMAVEAACFLASMEAMAFSEKDTGRLIEKGLELSGYQPLIDIVTDVTDHTRSMLDEGRKASLSDDVIFRQVRDCLEEHYGYRLYPGNCHVVPNLALILVCLILGEDSFYKAMRYCVSAGWDTDCNGANLGVLNGVRLGLDSLTDEFDLRGPVADRFYVVSARGGACVTDAVRETERILRLNALLYGEEVPAEKGLFSFSFPGSVQGFTSCPAFKEEAVCEIENPDGRGLLLRIPETGKGCVSALTMWDPDDVLANYLLMGSPLLYEGQTVKVRIIPVCGEVRVTPYILYYDYNDEEQCLMGEETWMIGTSEKMDELEKEENEGNPGSAESTIITGNTEITGNRKSAENPENTESTEKAEIIGNTGTAENIENAGKNAREKTSLQRKDFEWKIPRNHGFTIRRFGLRLEGTAGAEILVRQIDWDKAPEAYGIAGSLKNIHLGHPNMQLNAFTSSAKQFSFDGTRAFVVSDTEVNGLAVTGSEKWDDYTVSAVLNPSIHDRFGLIGRCRGNRRYYGLVFREGNTAQLIVKNGEKEKVLCQAPFFYEANQDIRAELSMNGTKICAAAGSVRLMSEDSTLKTGAAGFLIDRGTVLADDFMIRRSGKDL